MSRHLSTQAIMHTDVLRHPTAYVTVPKIPMLAKTYSSFKILLNILLNRKRGKRMARGMNDLLVVVVWLTAYLLIFGLCTPSFTHNSLRGVIYQKGMANCF